MFPEKVQHFFKDFRSITWGIGECWKHPDSGDGGCDLSETSKCDLCVVGLPCQPASTHRAKRFASGAVASHPKFELYNEFVVYLATKAPRSVIFEQVPGFGMPMESGQPSPLQLLTEKIQELGTYGMKIVKASPDVFIDIQRPRFSGRTKSFVTVSPGLSFFADPCGVHLRVLGQIY